MIGALLFLQQQTPDAHYAGGATSKIAGTTALMGKIARFLLSSVPQWVQLGGILIGVPVAIVVVWQAWKHRRAVWAWWVARPAAIKLALFSASFVVMAIGAGSGLVGYNYVMHDNDFCQSCHIMDTAWNRFQVSAHKDLQCHACHRQPMYVSSVELYYWVTKRMMTVPVHDKVPTTVCSECHMRERTDSTRTFVMLTAGHALHLKSDSSALKNVECVTCHGRSFHVFTPSNATCAQSGCHMAMRVNLGAMTSQSFQHCTMCHDFKNPVPVGTTVAEAKKKLVPKALDCSGCHAMTTKTASFDLAADPHKGTCGMCHDPHKQKEPAEAFKTCATAQCHSSADTLTAFHRGLRGHALDQCGACHQAHSWKVKGNNCLACHKGILQDRPSLKRTILKPTASISASKSVPRRSPSRLTRQRTRLVRMVSSRQRADTTFLHSRHKAIGCTECHGTMSTHGALKFSQPAGCLGCHHSQQQRVSCAACHKTETLGPYGVPVQFDISARRNPVSRPLTFTHTRHANVACARCHAADAKRSVMNTCTSCHADHHQPTADCASCHPTARTGHDRAVHAGCAGCHTDARVAALPVTRQLCVSCHAEQRNHYPTRDCGTCHALDPSAMLRAGKPGPGHY